MLNMKAGTATIGEITNDPYLLGLIIYHSEQVLLPPELVVALIASESGGESYACNYESLASTAMQAPRPEKCSIDTESVGQKMRWGLMQISGATARRLGYAGWLSQLSVPLVNLEWGIKYLVHLTNLFFKRHGYAGVVAAYHSGNPRKIGNEYVNQVYVDKVLSIMSDYKDIIADRRDRALECLETQILSPEDAEEVIRDDKGTAEYMSHTLDELKVMAVERGIETAKSWKKMDYAEALYNLDLDSALNAQNGASQG